MGILCTKAAPKPVVYNLTPDPVTGLRDRDRHLITESWLIIGHKKTIKENGAQLFLMLFAAFPYMQNYFRQLRKTRLSKLGNSTKLRIHAATVFYFIQSYVDNIDDPETLVSLVEKMAAAHIGRGLTVGEFENLRHVFPKFLQKLLGPKCTPELKEAWDILFRAQNALIMMVADESASGGDENDENDEGATNLHGNSHSDHETRQRARYLQV